MQIYCNWFTIIYRSLVPLLNFMLLIYGGNKNVLKIKLKMKVLNSQKSVQNGVTKLTS